MRFAPCALAAIALMAAGSVRAQPPSMKLALAYDGRLYIKVLDIQFDQSVDAASFASSARMKSYGLLALFKRFDIAANSQGHIAGGAPQPTTFDYLNHDGKRTRQVRVAWGENDVAMTSTPAFPTLGAPPATREQKLEATDPLTQMIRVALSPHQSGPCGTTGRFFDGKQLYELTYGPPLPATLSDDERAFGLVNPVRCTVRYSEIAGFKPKAPAKRTQAQIGPITAVLGQLGGGGPWVFTSLGASTSLGEAQIVLRHAQLTGSRP